MRIGTSIGIQRRALGGGGDGGGGAPINPLPSLATLTPSSGSVGAADTVVAVTGAGLMAGVTVFTLGGATLTSTTTDAGHASLTIPSSVLASAGTKNVVATNPSPGGGTSTALGFVVNNLAPALSAISPTSVSAGAGNTTVTCTGTAFQSNSVVYAGASALTTTYVSATSLTAVVPSGSLTAGGATLAITAQTPTPGGGTSASQTLTVNHLAPTLTSISPASINVGSGNTTITLTGTNFDSATVANRAGVALATTFVSATSVTAVVPSTNLAATGTSTITAVTPTPGGGTSGGQTLSVVNPAATVSSLGATTGERWFAARTLTVNGTFLAGATCAFGATSGIATLTNSGTVITFTIPDSELDFAGTASVIITNPTPGGGASSAATYTITQPANLRGEWRADVGVTVVSSKVTAWANQITGDTNMNAAQGTALAQPGYTAVNSNYNGKSTVDFSGSQLMATTTWATPLAQPATWFWCGDNSTGVMCFDGIAGAFRHILYNIGGLRNYQSASAPITHSGAFDKGIYCFNPNGASSAAYANSASTTDATGNPGTASMSGLTIGANYIGGSKQIGSTRMMLCFNATLTLAQRQQVGNYISRDSGLTWAA